VVVDPSSPRNVVRHRIGVIPFGLASEGSDLLITDAGRDLILTIDPRTGETRDERQISLPGPQRVASGAGIVASIAPTTDAVSLLTSTGLHVVPLPATASLVDVVVTEAGTTFVTDVGTPAIWQIDPKTLIVTKLPGGPDPSRLTATSEAVFVSVPGLSFIGVLKQQP
jgi:hypothetical protein